MIGKKILVSGASGLIGSALIESLNPAEYEITRLLRKPNGREREIVWDFMRPLTPSSVSGFDVVVHLAGESIFGLWTTAKKNRIRDSRVTSTRLLAQALAKANQPPQVFACASAIGYYGNRGDEILNESSASGAGFLAETCCEWEAAAQPAKDAGIRAIHARFGIVLSRKGGAMAVTLPTFRLGLGGKFGDGCQWWSWIHIYDVISSIQFAISNEALVGPINSVAPNPVTNADFTKMLASKLSRPAFFNVPGFVIREALRSMGEELFLFGQRVEPTKLQAAGFKFRFPELPPAFDDLLINDQ